ncbi:MAG: cobyric acid synthase [Stellaceae bacterium]
MLQGTGSDVGKSLLLAGMARAFVRRGLRVRPFKPQNMSNNAAVTAEGGEIGRAQALQARASRVEPTADMNPVLLKPQSEGGAQVVVEGRVWGSAAAAEYRRLAPSLLPRVLTAFGRLADIADLVLVEGAGSPAEVNLRAGDIANMGFAEAADVPVVLVGDIERGGVIAQLVGTHLLLSDRERALLAGYVVNKFRGDLRLFDGGIAAIGARTGLRSFGVVPFFPPAALLPAEDTLALCRGRIHPSAGAPAEEASPQPIVGATPSPQPSPPRGRGGMNMGGEWVSRARPAASAPVKIAVPVLPRIANFDDLDPLCAEPDVEIVMVRPGRPLPREAALVILPGSKSTIADLEFLRREGWDIDILAHRRHGGRILGLCGGYQMLGRTIADPLGVEGRTGTAPGLGLLDIDTVLGGEKQLGRAAGVDIATGMAVEGYEMHLGRTTGPGLERPMLRLIGRAEGAVSADGLVAGCYLHGLFAGDGYRCAFLEGLGAAGAVAYEHMVEATLEALADHLEQNLDLAALLAAARPPRLR